MKKILLLTMILILAATTVLADAVFYVAVDELNMRKATSTDAERVTKLYIGEMVSLDEGPTKDGWAKVCLSGDGWARRGWVRYEYLTTEKGYQEWRGVLVAEKGKEVNIRYAPGGAKQDKLAVGTEVTVLYPSERDGVEWYRVKYRKGEDAYKGFVMAEFVGEANDDL